MTLRAPGRLADFVKLHPEVEAVVQSVGRETWDLVLVDVTGNWRRGVFHAEADAEAVALDLRVRMHRGWDEPRMARRMNGRDHWNTRGGQRRAL